MPFFISSLVIGSLVSFASKLSNKNCKLVNRLIIKLVTVITHHHVLLNLVQDLIQKWLTLAKAFLWKAKPSVKTVLLFLLL